MCCWKTKWKVEVFSVGVTNCLVDIGCTLLHYLDSFLVQTEANRNNQHETQKTNQLDLVVRETVKYLSYKQVRPNCVLSLHCLVTFIFFLDTSLHCQNQFTCLAMRYTRHWWIKIADERTTGKTLQSGRLKLIIYWKLITPLKNSDINEHLFNTKVIHFSSPH